MDEQKINDLIYEIRNLIRTIDSASTAKPYSGSDTSTSKSSSGSKIKFGDVMDRGVNRIVNALGKLDTTIRNQDASRKEQQRAMRRFTADVNRATSAQEKQTSALNKTSAQTVETTRLTKESGLEWYKSAKSLGRSSGSLGDAFLSLGGESRSATAGLGLLSAGFGGATKAFTGYASSLIKGERGAKLSARALEDFANPLLELAGTAGGFLIQLGLARTGLGKIPGVSKLTGKALGALSGRALMTAGALASTAAILGKGFVKFTTTGMEQADALFDSFQKLSQVGIRGAGGMDDIFTLLQEAGVGTGNLTHFNALLAKNSQSLGMMGGTIMDGARAFTKVAGGIYKSKLGEKLMALGMQQDEMNELAMVGMSIDARRGTLLKRSTDEQTAATAKFVYELDQAAQLTGASRKDAAEARNAAMQEVKFRAARITAERNGDTEKLRQLDIAEKMAATAKNFGDTKGFSGILEQAAGGNTSANAVAAQQTYDVQGAMRMKDPTQAKIQQHMARSVELQQQTFSGAVAMTGELTNIHTSIVASDDLLKRQLALEEGAAKAGFTGADAVDRFLATEEGKRLNEKGPKGAPANTELMIDAARMQQNAALIIDKAVNKLSNAANIHETTATMFADSVKLFAKIAGVKPDKLDVSTGGQETARALAKDLQYKDARRQAEDIGKVQAIKPTEAETEQIAQQILAKGPNYGDDDKTAKSAKLLAEHTGKALEIVATPIFGPLARLLNGGGFAEGGVAEGSKSGYLALLHGKEKITPWDQVGESMGTMSKLGTSAVDTYSGKSAGKGEVGSGPAFSKVSEMSALLEKVIEGIDKSNLYLKDILDEITGGATVGGAKAGGTSDMTAAMNAHDKGHQHEAPTVTPEAAQQLGKGIGSPLADLKVTSGFGMRTDPITGKQAGHGGVDLAGAIGAAIKAPEAGTARVVAEKDSGGYGNMVEILDSQGKVMHRMAHMSETMVKTGDKIEAGADIGKVGSTGRSTGAHLHWEKFDPTTGQQIDPMAWLAQQQGKTPGFGTTGGGAATGNPQAARRGQNMGSPQMSSTVGPGFGAIAEKYETGGRGSGTVGWDSTGGTSYGKYQIASKVGSMDAYIKHLAETNPEAAAQLKAAGPSDTGGTSGKFVDTWKQLSASGALGDTEASFMKKQAYDPAMAGIKNKGLQDMIGGDKGLQEMLFSTATQHGGAGASGIMNKVYKEGMTKEDLVKATYAERGTRFGSSTPEVQKSVLGRFGREQQDVLAMMGQPGVAAPTAMAGAPVAGAAPTAMAGAPVAGAAPTAMAGAAPTAVAGFNPGAQQQRAQQPVTIAGMAQNILGSIFGGFGGSAPVGAPTGITAPEGIAAPGSIAGPTLPGPSTDMSAITQALQAQTTATQSAITSSMENMTNRLVESLGTAGGGGGAGVAGAEVPGLLGDIVSAQREQTAAINRLISVQTA